MRHALYTPVLDAHVRAAWQEQMGAAVHTPGLLPELMRRRHELFPRFAAYYTQLHALPRRVRRALQRQWRLPLAGVALLLALGQPPAQASMIPVDGACTLVDAITAANTDTVTGGCPAGNGADTIVLPANSTQILTEVNNSTYGPTGLPVISSVITIAGQESTITRGPAAPEFRLLAVNNTGELTLQETTVRGGIALAPGNPASYYGGGVASFFGGILTILNSTITDNTAIGGGGAANFFGNTLAVLNSTITGNTATFGGGGVANFASGTLTIRNSTITGNTAGAHGGGVKSGGSYHGGGTLSVTNSTIAGNTAFYLGGGVANFFDTLLTMTNSTIADNTAYSDGGGVHNGGTLTVTNSTIAGNTSRDSFGGGIANLSYATLTVLNSTITGNTAGAHGGGVANEGPLTMLNTTITDNTALEFCGYYGCYGGRGGGVANYGTLTLARTLVAGNAASTGPEIYNVSDGTVLADNHNLFGVNRTAGVVGFSPSATDVVPPAGVLLPDILDPMLAFNGGPTQTHALVPGSPAIDAGDTVCTDANGDPLLTDQRGKLRPVDGDGNGTAACDIGAFEFFPMVNDLVTLDPALDTAFDPTPVPDGPAGTFTITATFTNTSDAPLHFPFFTVTELSGGNLVLNADEGAQGVGATVTPEVAGDVLAPGASVTVEFVLGLQVRERFTFLVDLFGEPLR